MLTDLHASLNDLLLSYGRIDPFEVDIAFKRPTEEWVDSLTRPTINLFLFSIQENTTYRETNVQTQRGATAAQWRMPVRRIDLHYQITALTTEDADEHELLWRVLATLMRHRELPTELLSERLRRADCPITTRVADQTDGAHFIELWSALGVPMRPALSYVVTAPLDLEIASESPLVLTRRARYVRTGAGGPIETALHIGGTVLDATRKPVPDATVALESSAAEGARTGEDGRFTLHGVPSGRVTLQIQRGNRASQRVTLDVPSDSYEVVLTD